MKWFNNPQTLEELKKQYKQLALKHHPDIGGNLKDMQEINTEYDQLFEKLKNIHRSAEGRTYTSKEETTEVGLIIVETTTEETTTEEPTTNEASFIERIKNHDRYLLTVIGVSVAATELILVTVLILVLKNRSYRKKKEEELEKQKLIIEEKRDR